MGAQGLRLGFRTASNGRAGPFTLLSWVTVYLTTQRALAMLLVACECLGTSVGLSSKNAPGVTGSLHCPSSLKLPLQMELRLTLVPSEGPPHTPR